MVHSWACFLKKKRKEKKKTTWIKYILFIKHVLFNVPFTHSFTQQYKFQHKRIQNIWREIKGWGYFLIPFLIHLKQSGMILQSDHQWSVELKKKKAEVSLHVYGKWPKFQYKSIVEFYYICILHSFHAGDLINC